MGNDGRYSFSARSDRTETYKSMKVEEILSQRTTHNLMSPEGVSLRESRDSDIHPNSIPIIIGIDTTASMGSVPDYLVKDGLPAMMGRIIQTSGIPDPQIMIMGIGDHECDRAPLQIGQFESSDTRIDEWLTKLWLEKGGGGNTGESYLLAWYFAAYRTSIDSLEKRGKKGVLITIGDEKTLPHLPKENQISIFGKDQYGDETASDLLAKAREKYNVHHLHIKETGQGSYIQTQNFWKQMMGDDFCHLIDHHQEVPDKIADIVSKHHSPSQDSRSDNEILIPEQIDTEVGEVPPPAKSDNSDIHEML